MGPGVADTGKQGAPPPYVQFHGDPYFTTGQQTFTEIFRRSVIGYTKGKLLVNAQCTTGPAVGAPVPGFYIDCRITGATQTTEEVLLYGATGTNFQGSLATTNRPDEADMSSAPLRTEWTDEDGFDQIIVCVRTMLSGIETSAPASGSALVNVTGFLWR
jgi:hypothetical protein